MIDVRAPITIDPDGWYSDGQARLLLDLPSATLARARRKGGLRYAKAGNRILYQGQWLTDWLSSSAEGVSDAAK
jgi:hypothetical protein